MRLWLVLVLACLPGLSLADDVTLRTGWHDTFTRIVVSFPSGTAWELGRTEAGFALVLEDVAGIQTANFFDRIPLDRITQVEVDDNQSLLLTTICDCHADAFLWRPDKLVVDIKDGAAPNDHPFDAMLLRDANEDTPARATPIVDLGLMPKPRARVDLASISPLQDLQVSPPDLSNLEQTIINGLVRAADQGLLQMDAGADIAPSDPEPTGEPANVLTEDDIADPVPPPHQASQALTPGLKTRTSVDLGLRLLDPAIDQTPVGINCWPDAFVAVADWAEGMDFHEETSRARAQIFGEFDRVNSDAVTTLARVYVAYGLGREAIQTLTIDGQMSSERAAIHMLAEIVDADPLSSGALAGQLQCPGDVALWALLAMPEDVVETPPDELRLIRQFRALPRDLQRHLSARMAARLVNLDNPDGAELILDPALKAEHAPIDAAVLQAEITADRGDRADATEALMMLANSDARLPPEALIQLVTLQMEAQGHLEHSLIALIEAQRFEYRDEPVGADLARAEILARLYIDDFRTARHQLAALPKNPAHPHLAELQHDVIQQMTRRADDILFLEMAFEDNVKAADGDIANAVAERLLQLGFPDQAAEILAPPAKAEAMAERRYLRAQAAMDANAPQLAAQHLSGVTTPRAKDILAGFGHVAADQSAPFNDASRAWRRGDWSALATGEDVLLRDASSLILNPVDPVPDQVQPLASGRALLEQADATRATVNGLLNRFEAPDVAPN